MAVRPGAAMVMGAVVGVCALWGLAVGARAQSPTRTTTQPTATSTPTPPATIPSPPPSPTPTAPTYDGRPCDSGTLINDFVIVGDREPVPSCTQPFTPTAPEELYALSPVPPGLRLRGVERSTVAGAAVVSVVYEATAGISPGGAVVRVSLQRDGLSKPYPIRLLLRGQASPADFLPAPGVLLEPGAASQIGYWFGPAGLYVMVVESPGLPLEIRDLARLLRPATTADLATPTPSPPRTGLAAPRDNSDARWWPALLAAPLVAGALALATRRR